MRLERKMLTDEVVKRSQGLCGSNLSSSPETVKYNPKEELPAPAKEKTVLVKSDDEEAEDSDALEEDWSSSSSEWDSYDGQEVFNPLDENALGRLPPRLREGMMELQRAREERRNNQLGHGGIRIVTPSDTDSVHDENTGDEPQRVKNDGIHLLNSMSLNTALHAPSRDSSSATAPRVLRVVNKSSKGSVLSPESQRVNRPASFESTHWPESVIPMQHWQNESARIGLAQSERPAASTSRSTAQQHDEIPHAAALSKDARRSPRKRSNSFFRAKIFQRFGGSDRCSKDGSAKSYLNRLFRRGNGNGNPQQQEGEVSPTPAPRTRQVRTMEDLYGLGGEDFPERQRLQCASSPASPTRPRRDPKKGMTFRGRMEGYE